MELFHNPEVRYFAHPSIDAADFTWYAECGWCVKTVYITMIADCLVTFCMAALCACVYLLGLASWLEWIRVLYAIAAIALGIVIAVNREVIRRSKDEMVKYMLGKIDTLLLRASEIFAFALVIVTAIWLEGNGGAVAALLCIWLFAVFTARLIMFRRYDRAGIE